MECACRRGGTLGRLRLVVDQPARHCANVHLANGRIERKNGRPWLITPEEPEHLCAQYLADATACERNGLDLLKWSRAGSVLVSALDTSGFLNASLLETPFPSFRHGTIALLSGLAQLRWRQRGKGGCETEFRAKARFPHRSLGTRNLARLRVIEEYPLKTKRAG